MNWTVGQLSSVVASRNVKVNKGSGRFRQVPTFGRDTIRRFSRNVSELKKMAARDFEDLLQVCIVICFYIPGIIMLIFSKCSIAVFDGLLPEPHNEAVLKLLFLASHWHGLAKLRIHTDQTLDIFDTVTLLVGVEFREFRDKTCSHFATRELPRETEARKRRAAKKFQGPANQSDNNQSPDASGLGPLPKPLNNDTYKHHSLGDYPATIRRYGTTDSYSTEPVGCLPFFSCITLTVEW